MTYAPEEILRSNLNLADMMLSSLSRTNRAVSAYLPLKAEQISSLVDKQVDEIDLFLARFGKLQDFMVSKVFKSLVIASLEDDSQDVSILDRLHHMEKFGVIESAEEWKAMRLLRNSIAHVYLTTAEEVCDNINSAWVAFRHLESAIACSYDFAEKHIFIASDYSGPTP